ncbi:hypothetical protein OC842_001561 [Tilletia horrida]|uniref:Uncharacterized protein n=1 Tax=Tilletia horrida TaxID=155126 RepID=A0AAN6JLW4_9BASI|nr:hypothetical protein OC842_001561 [Tilletia horrida]
MSSSEAQRGADDGSRSRSSSAASQQQQPQHQQQSHILFPSSASSSSATTPSSAISRVAVSSSAASTYSSSSSSVTSSPPPHLVPALTTHPSQQHHVASAAGISGSAQQQQQQQQQQHQSAITPALLGAYDPRYMRLHMTAPTQSFGSTLPQLVGGSIGIGISHSSDPMSVLLPTDPALANLDLGPMPPPQRAASSLGRYTQQQQQHRPHSIASSSSPPSPTFLQTTAAAGHTLINQHFQSGAGNPALRHHGSGSGLGLTLSSPAAPSAPTGSTSVPSLSHNQGSSSSLTGAAGSAANPNPAAYVPTSEQWEAVSRRLMPLFQHQRIRGTIEEVNDLVNAHIDQTIQRGPARALDALSRDCSVLVANGMQAIGAKLVPLAQQISLTARQVHAHRQQNQRSNPGQAPTSSAGQGQPSPSSTYEEHYSALANRLLERLKEQWTYVYTTVLPFLEGALLPLQTNPVLVSLTARGATYKPPAQNSSALSEAGHGYHQDSGISQSQTVQFGYSTNLPSQASQMGAMGYPHNPNAASGPASGHLRRQSGGVSGSNRPGAGSTTSAFRTQKIDVRHIVLECFRNQCLVALNGICVQSTPSVALGLAGTEFTSLCGEGGADSHEDGGLLRAFLREVSGESGSSPFQLPGRSAKRGGPAMAAAAHARSPGNGIAGSHATIQPSASGGGFAAGGARAESPSTVRTSPSTHPRALRAAASRAAGTSGSMGAKSSAAGPGSEEGLSLNAGLRQMKAVLSSIRLERPQAVHLAALVAT